MFESYDGLLSLLLASIELVLILNLLIFSEKNKVNKLTISLIVLLFAYQATEFVICGLGNKTSLFAYLALLIVSFMPPLSLIIILQFLNYRSKLNNLLFLPALFFAFYYPLVIDQFVVSKCTAIYAAYNYPLGFIYGVFYYLPILIVIILLTVTKRTNLHPNKEKPRKTLLIGYVITFIPAFLFTRLIPGMLEAVESIICTFAFILALFLTYFVLKNKSEEENTSEK
jgi:hypothetical protein